MAKRRFYRTKLGRFTTRGRYEGARKREKARQAKRKALRKPAKRRPPTPKPAPELAKRKPAFRQVFKGRAFVARRGYSILVSALVPGTWDTGSEPVFEADGSEQFHLVYWSTKVVRTVEEVRTAYKVLVDFETTTATFGGQEFAVLASELRVTTVDGDIHTVATWTGTKIPNKLKGI